MQKQSIGMIRQNVCAEHDTLHFTGVRFNSFGIYTKTPSKLQEQNAVCVAYLFQQGHYAAVVYRTQCLLNNTLIWLIHTSSRDSSAAKNGDSFWYCRRDEASIESRCWPGRTRAVGTQVAGRGPTAPNDQLGWPGLVKTCWPLRALRSTCGAPGAWRAFPTLQ